MGAVKNRLVEIAYELIELEPALSFEDAFSRVSGISMSGMEDTMDYRILLYRIRMGCKP